LIICVLSSFFLLSFLGVYLRGTTQSVVIIGLCYRFSVQRYLPLYLLALLLVPLTW